MKANFNIKKNRESDDSAKVSEKSAESKKELTESEFEEFIVKSGAKGSFMIFRSAKKEDELGLEEL